MAVASIASYVRSHPAYADDAAEPEWLSARRRAALARFEKLGFPSIRMENWKYTSTKKMSRVAFAHAKAGGEPLASGFGDVAVAARLVFVDGHFRAQASSVGALPDGVTVEPISMALQRDPEGLRAALSTWDAANDSAFSSMNSAFMQDGVVVRVGRGVQLEHPIAVEFFSGGDGDPVVSHPRNLVMMDRLSRAHLIETYSGHGTTRQLTNTLTEVTLAEGARLDHVLKVESGKAGWLVGRTRVHQSRDSHYQTHGLWNGGAWSRHDIEVVLAGFGAACDLSGLYAPVSGEHVDVHTMVDHAVAHCISRELYKGVLSGRSKAVFNGRILMRHGAVGSDSEQANRNLLLSPQADVNTKPELEIYNDDVKAAHGTTVGQMDMQQVFYLRSRGLSDFDARRLLTSAFAAQVMRSLSHEGLRNILLELVADRLACLHRLEMS